MLCTKNSFFYFLHFFIFFSDTMYIFTSKMEWTVCFTTGSIAWPSVKLGEIFIVSYKKIWKFSIFTKIFIFRAEQILLSYYVPNLIEKYLIWRYENKNTKAPENVTSCDMGLNTNTLTYYLKQSKVSKFARFFDFATVFARS